MPLAAGDELGPYRILEPIGEGGMGEVYRARDLKLERDVAVKVLPEGLAEDEERLARFEREAKVLASLNHPNIAAIYGFESGAIVLELVEGPTLEDRIRKGSLPLDEVIRIAIQIAEALEAGHEASVVHRDLKPANIKVRDDGTVKVLDYGLAKALENDAPDGGDSELSQSPTLTRQGTQVGVILGTAAYMSPEQAKGKKVDRRADVWAFGVVLYEMLTGKRAFAGGDVSETLAFVLTRELDESALPTTTPPAIRRLLRRCVAREPRGRLADMSTARLELEDAAATAEPSTQEPGPAMNQPRLTTLALAAAALVAGALVWSLVSQPEAPVRSLTRFQITLPELEFFSGTGRHTLALAPDGSFFVYTAAQGLMMRRMAELDRTALSVDNRAREPFVSPDGQWIGFHADGQLHKIAASGGAPVALCEAESPYGASWTDDNTILFGQGATGIWRVPATGGRAENIIEVANGELAHGPQLLPGGEWVLFTLRGASVGSWDDASIVVQSLETGERETVLQGAREARYLPSGHLVYASNAVLFGVAFDVGRRSVVGGPVPLVPDVASSGATTGAAQFGVSSTGTLVYIRGAEAAGRDLIRVSRNGDGELVGMPDGRWLGLSVSPDGTRAAIETEDADIWVADLTRGSTIRVTAQDSRENGPVLSPNGQSVVFASNRGGAVGLYRKAADGTGTAERFFTAEEAAMIVPFEWTPDGNALLVTLFDSNGDEDIGRVGLDGTWEPLFDSDVDEGYPALSPDGRWIAYRSRVTGLSEVYLERYPELGGRRPVSSGGGFGPRWAPDGSGLYYLRASVGPPEAIMRVAVEHDSETISLGRPEELLPWVYYDQNVPHKRYGVLPDGRFLMANSVWDRRTTVVVENWLTELTERVPVP